MNRYTITRFAVVLSTRDKVGLVTEVRIFFRVSGSVFKLIGNSVSKCRTGLSPGQ